MSLNVAHIMLVIEMETAETEEAKELHSKHVSGMKSIVNKVNLARIKAMEGVASKVLEVEGK